MRASEDQCTLLKDLGRHFGLGAVAVEATVWADRNNSRDGFWQLKKFLNAPLRAWNVLSAGIVGRSGKERVLFSGKSELAMPRLFSTRRWRTWQLFRILQNNN